jgi:hypothetical protein
LRVRVLRSDATVAPGFRETPGMSILFGLFWITFGLFAADLALGKIGLTVDRVGPFLSDVGDFLMLALSAAFLTAECLRREAARNAKRIAGDDMRSQDSST